MVVLVLIASSLPRLSSLILLGSITWDAHYIRLAGDQPMAGITRSRYGPTWNYYIYYDDGPGVVVPRSVGCADIAWGSDRYSGSTMKRVLRNFGGLPINSTFNNISVPYFTIDAFEWISDPVSTLPDPQLKVFMAPGDSRYNPLFSPAAPVIAIIPKDLRWGRINYTSITFPAPTSVSETRFLAILYYYDVDRREVSCRRNMTNGFFIVPEGAGIYTERSLGHLECLIFARMTYTAGAADCVDCVVSANLVIQNDTALTVRPDSMTAEALNLMPLSITTMGLGNASLPSPNNITQYAFAALRRSYGAVWTSLHDYLTGPGTTSGIKIAVPMSRANVSKWRVFVWMAINLLQTLAAVLFFSKIQRGKKFVAETVTAPFLLDMSQVGSSDFRRPADNEKDKLIILSGPGGYRAEWKSEAEVPLV